MSGRILYDWVDGFHGPRNLDAQTVGEELDRIRVVKGTLTAETVLAEAGKRRSPIHAVFEWDDAEAARQHRLDQARRLIAAVTIRSIADEPSPPVRAFVHLRTEDGQRSYVPTVDAREDPELRKQILAAALAEANSWRRRYQDLAEFTNVVAAIDDAQEALALVA